MNHPTPPKRFRPKEILAFLRAVTEWNQRNRLVSSSTLVVSDDANGRQGHVQIEEAGRAGTGGAHHPPFSLLDASDDDAKKIRVLYSTIGNIVPTGFAPGDEPPFEFTVTGSGVVFGKVTVDIDLQSITSVAVEKAPTMPANTDTVFHVLIGSWTIDDGELSLANARYGPIGVIVCGDVVIWG